jgi:hypothetical protein
MALLAVSTLLHSWRLRNGPVLLPHNASLLCGLIVEMSWLPISPLRCQTRHKYFYGP